MRRMAKNVAQIHDHSSGAVEGGGSGRPPPTEAFDRGSAPLHRIVQGQHGGRGLLNETAVVWMAFRSTYRGVDRLVYGHRRNRKLA